MMRVTANPVSLVDDRESDDELDLEADETQSDEADAPDAGDIPSTGRRRRFRLLALIGVSRLVFGVLPIVVLMLGGAAAFLKWQDSWTRASTAARTESLTAAKEITVAMLAYQPDTVEKDLGAARDRLTGPFRDSYSQLIHDVVIPGAKKQHVSSIATVAAAAAVTATPDHAVDLLFVNQTATVGNDSPTETASAVKVTLDRVGSRWLVSGFDPV